MSGVPDVPDDLAREADSCLARIERWVAAAERDPAAPSGDAARAARALRDAATAARQPELVGVAAAIEQAIERHPAPGRATDGAPALDAVVAAVAAFRAALGEPRRVAPPADDAPALPAPSAPSVPDAHASDAAPPAPGGDRIVPIRALAADGDREFVVHRAATPPGAVGHRFRAASVPLARTVRQLVAEARGATGAASAPAPGTLAPALAPTLGADLRAVLAELRELAESYDVRPVATFFGGREAGAEALDARTLAAVDAAATGLITGQPTTPVPGPATPAETGRLQGGEVSDAASAAPSTTSGADAPAGGPTTVTPAFGVGAVDWPPAPQADEAPLDGATHDAPPMRAAPARAPGERDDAFRPPTGEALVALLQTGISSFGHLAAFDVAPPPPPEPAQGAVVPIEHLLYSGRSALERARAVRDELRARPGPPDPALLDELYELLDLAGTG